MPGPLDQLLECTGFQWDEGNAEKNWLRHKVSRVECEEVFFNEPLLVAADAEHSGVEPRFYALPQPKLPDKPAPPPAHKFEQEA